MDEQQLLRAAAKGDSGAFSAIVEKYQDMVYRTAFRMVGNAVDAQDLSQEAFLRIWRNLSSFSGDSAFSTWLYRVTTNLCIDFLRGQKKTVSLTLMQEEAQWDMEDPQPSPEAQLLVREQQLAIQTAMEALEPEARQILILRAVDACSYEEIGEILQMPVGTVKSRLSRARSQLRKKLNQIPAASSKREKGGA